MDTFPHLFILAEVVVGKVLTLLSFKDLSKLDVACNNKNMRKQLTIWYRNTISSCQDEKQLNGFLLRWLKKRGIKLTVASVWCLNCPEEQLLAGLATEDVHVEEIYLSCLADPVVERILACLHRVRSVIIKTGYGCDTSFRWEEFFVNNSTLETFELWGGWKLCDASALLNSVTKLSSTLIALTINGCSNMQDDAVVALVSRCRQLQRVKLTKCHSVTDQSLHALAQHCRGLRVLELAAAHSAVSLSAVVDLLQCCPEMTELSLWDCSGIKNSVSSHHNHWLASMLKSLKLGYCPSNSEPFLTSIISNNHMLQSIALPNSPGATDAVLAAMGQHCRFLQNLDLLNCTNITDLTPLSNCPALHMMEITGCAGVTDNALLQLAASPGRSISVYAKGTGVSEGLLQRSTRIALRVQYL